MDSVKKSLNGIYLKTVCRHYRRHKRKEVRMNYTLGKQDLYKIGKGLAIALAGAALTYLSTTVPHVNFGAWTPLVVALWSVVVNSAWKVLDGVKQ